MPPRRRRQLWKFIRPVRYWSYDLYDDLFGSDVEARGSSLTPCRSTAIEAVLTSLRGGLHVSSLFRFCRRVDHGVLDLRRSLTVVAVA